MEPREHQHYEMWPEQPANQPAQPATPFSTPSEAPPWPTPPEGAPWPAQPPTDPWSTPGQPEPASWTPTQPYPSSGPPYQDPSSVPPYPQPYSPAYGSPQPQPQPQPQPYPAPAQPGMYPPGYPVPTQQGGSNRGLLYGVIIGGAVMILAICGIGGYVYYHKSGTTNGANPTAPATTGAHSQAASASPDPQPTARDVATLDRVGTDTTPFEMRQFYPRDAFTGKSDSYNLVAAGTTYNACNEFGGSNIDTLMSKNGCGKMTVGVYLNSAKTIMTSVMVLPLPDAASATAVMNGIKTNAALAEELAFFCPPTPQAGSQICATNPTGLRWWFSYDAFHRYFVLATSLSTNGVTPSDPTQHQNASSDCWLEVVAAIPKIR